MFTFVLRQLVNPDGSIKGIRHNGIWHFLVFEAWNLNRAKEDFLGWLALNEWAEKELPNINEVELVIVIVDE